MRNVCHLNREALVLFSLSNLLFLGQHDCGSMSSTSRFRSSAWLARRIRKSRQRRSRAALWATAAAVSLLVLPVFVRLPVQINESVIPKEALTSSSTECEANQGGLVIRQGAGTYKLDKPLGVVRHDDKNDEGLLPTSWSQYGQDLWVDTYFGQKRGGTFLEVGGFDGEMHSNTLFLEKERGWQGILVEANPYSFQIMQTKDRSCWMAHTCIQSGNHTHLNFKLAGGITAALEVASAQHTQRMQQDTQHYRHEQNWKGAGETWCIPCVAFDEILQQTFLLSASNLTTIDYFSLDVEGAEFELLQTLLGETNKFPKIRLFTIEMQENAHEIRSLLLSKNYQEIATVGIDSVFVLQSGV